MERFRKNHTHTLHHTPAVAQCGQQNPKCVSCMFSLADAHIVNLQPRVSADQGATIRVVACAHVIVKALKEGDQHTLLLHARLEDHAKAALLPVDLELQLVVLTTVYQWLQAFHDLR